MPVVLTSREEQHSDSAEKLIGKLDINKKIFECIVLEFDLQIQYFFVIHSFDQMYDLTL